MGCGGRFALATLAAFIALFVFDYVFHRVLMMPYYLETASLWRPADEMAQYMPWMLFKQIAVVAVANWIFLQNYEGKGIREGVRFGLAIGLLMGLIYFGSYHYLPIPLKLALLWLAGGVLEGIVIGITLALVWCKKTKTGDVAQG